MEREKLILDLKTFKYITVEGQSDQDEPEYEEMEHSIVEADTSKGYTEEECIIKRNSDGKCFKFEYRDSDQVDSLDHSGLGNEFPITGQEVFPKQIMKTIYE